MITPFGNARRTGEHAGKAIAEAPETAWVFESDPELIGAPAWDGDLVVVLDADGGVHGLDARTGSPRWTRQNEWGPDWIAASAVITSTGVLYLHDEEIIELDRATGEVVRTWEQTGDHLVLLDDVLLVDGTEAVDLATRATRWTTREASLLAPPAVHDGVLVAADGFDGHRVHGGVRASRFETGEELWTIGDRQNIECNAPARNAVVTKGDWEIPGLTHPVIAEGRVWFTRLRRHHDTEAPHPQPWRSVEFVGCDLRTGAEDRTWTPVPGRHHVAPLKAPAHTNALLLCVTTTAGLDLAEGAHLEAVPDEILLTALDTRTMEPSWQSPLPGVPVGSPAIAGGVVHVITTDGTVMAMDAANGRTRWTYSCDEPAGAAADGEVLQFEEEPVRLVPGDGSLLVQTADSVRLLR